MSEVCCDCFRRGVVKLWPLQEVWLRCLRCVVTTSGGVS